MLSSVSTVHLARVRSCEQLVREALQGAMVKLLVDTKAMLAPEEL